MSYQDIARGAGSSVGVDMPRPQPTRMVEGLLLKLANHISALKKLVDALGGPRDTIEHRHKIADTNSTIQDLARQIKDTLSRSHDNAAATANPEAQQKSKKLLQDFAALLQDYKSTQKVAQDREASSLPKPSPASRAAAQAAIADMDHVAVTVADDASEQAALLKAQQAQQLLAREAEMAHNEALIAERDAGIRDIVHQIGEVNEMFQDLAVLINDQGVQVRTIDEQITTTAERAKEGSRELVKAQRSQRAYRNKCLWLWLIAALVTSLIIILLFA